MSEGHSLVIPRRHGADGMALHRPEWNAVVELQQQRRGMLSAQGATISGWAGSWVEDLGEHSCEAVGKLVFSAHWHLILRRLVGLLGASGWAAGGDSLEAGVSSSVRLINAAHQPRGTSN